jgi:hypothetical protein
MEHFKVVGRMDFLVLIQRNPCYKTTHEAPSFVLLPCHAFISAVFRNSDCLACTGPTCGPSGAPSPEIMTAMQQEKVLPIHWDAKQGILLLGVRLTEKAGTASPQYILNDSLPYGVEQNDLGMDRGQIEIFSQVSLSGGPRLVHFEPGDRQSV